MAWRPLLSWIMSSSSSSSSSYSSSEHESKSEDDLRHGDPGNNNVQQAQKGHNVDDHDNEDDDNDVSYEPHEDEEDDEEKVEEPKSSSTSDYSFTIYEPRLKRRRIDHENEALTSLQEVKKRRGKRVWCKDDELELLRGFLDYYGTRQTKITRTTAKETSSLYEEIKPRLTLECNKTKMVEKLRRLKRKYHNVVKKTNEINSSGKEFRFKNAHDNAVFELSHMIWNVENRNNCVVESHNNNVMVKREEDNVAASSSVADHERPTTWFDENNNVTNVDDNINTGHDVRRLIVGLAMNPMPLSLKGKMGSGGGGGGGGVGEVVEDQKWRQQQILELESYEKRLDLVQHQVKAALEELRTKGGAH
ncbi:hypothetical protein ACFX12_033532 [Malus domestica]